jgi:hypothetical protein
VGLWGKFGEIPTLTRNGQSPITRHNCYLVDTFALEGKRVKKIVGRGVVAKQQAPKTYNFYKQIYLKNTIAYCCGDFS